MSALPSPCVGICTMDDAAGLCTGCARTSDEVAVWPELDDVGRRAVFEALARRRRESGYGFRIVGEPREAMIDRAQAWLRDPALAWSAGTYGALAEFRRDAGEKADILIDEAGGRVVTARGGLHVHLSEKFKALDLVEPGDDAEGAPTRVAFSMHQAKILMRPSPVIVERGPDRNALRGEDRTGILFDLGFNTRHTAFCVRTADPQLLGLLRAHHGKPLFVRGAPVLEALREANPHRVVMTPLARIEVFGPIPRHAPGARTPDGPHTHLVPELLARNLPHEPGLRFPPTYRPCLTVHFGGA
jgi:predicted Fe-S protein YdhL (DUF1289 family)